MDDVKAVLKQIFDFHCLIPSKEAKISWYSNLKDFTAAEIQSAWQEWRAVFERPGKTPSPWEFVRIIKDKKKPFGLVAQDAPELRKGISETQDSLIINLENMYTNMPDLLNRIRESNSFAEKFILCGIAMDKPEVMQSPIMQMLVKKLERAKTNFNDV
jgi:hypothetical protein